MTSSVLLRYGGAVAAAHSCNMHRPHHIRLTELNPHLTCIICAGYFVNATTITECLHSFCRSCIVKYLEANKYCPICEVQIHKTKPLINLRSDQTLQDIVYKLVPGLFQNEMQRRKTFYAANPTVVKPADPEQSGELSERSYIYTSEDYISLSLEYYANNSDNAQLCNQSRRYLRCPAAVSILHIQKLIRAKYGLTAEHKVDILYQNEELCEDFTLIDVAYSYLWKRKGPLHLTYRIFETACRKKLKLDHDYTGPAPAPASFFSESALSPGMSTNELVSVDNLTSDNVENNQNQGNNIDDCDPLTTNTQSAMTADLRHSHPVAVLSNYNNNKLTKSGNVPMAEDSSSVALPDKEVHLQISETGIISVTTCISSDVANLTSQTIAVTCQPATLACDPVPPTNAPNSSSAPVIPNLLPIVSSRSDSKSVDVAHTTASGALTVSAASDESPPPADRKRKLSISNRYSSVKKTANKVPLIVSIPTKLPESAACTTPITTAAMPTNTLLKPSKLSLQSTRKVQISRCSSPPTSATTALPAASAPNETAPPSKVPAITVLSSSKPATQTVTTTTIQPSAKPPVHKFEKSPAPKPTALSLSKKSQVVGYKTLRDPPKSWNPTLPPRNAANNHLYRSYHCTLNASTKTIPATVGPLASHGSTTTALTPALTSPAHTSAAKPKPNKFFKVRNNMPRYLGNPASGVKPMYQISAISAPSTTVSMSAASRASDLSTTSKAVVTQPSAKKPVPPLVAPKAGSLAAGKATPAPKSTVGEKAATSVKPGELNSPTPETIPSLPAPRSTDPTQAAVVADPAVTTPVAPPNESPLDAATPRASRPKTATAVEPLTTTSATNDRPPSYTQTAARTSLKLALSCRNNPMTVSEMLQLRNSPKATTAAAVAVPPRNSPDSAKSSEVLAADADGGHRDKESEASAATEVAQDSSKMDEDGHSSESSTELKISQTTVPIYSPRLKQKSESKFLKLSANAKLDAASDSKQSYGGAAAMVEKPERGRSPKTPKLAVNTKQTLSSGGAAYEHMSSGGVVAKAQQLSPQLDHRLGAKVKPQSLKVKPATGAGERAHQKSTPAPTTSKNSSKCSELSLPAQKFNFIPPNPFIPNLSSPNLNPGQFLFPNYINAAAAAMSNYDPRLLSQHNLNSGMTSLSSPYRLPISLSAMLYNQHRLGYVNSSAANYCSLMSGPGGASATTRAASPGVPASDAKLTDTRAKSRDELSKITDNK